METLPRLARQIAHTYHAGQTRKDGTPYFIHVEAVAAMLHYAGEPSYLVAAGYLHDVLEDCDVTTEQLIGQGIDPVTMELVEEVTRPKDVKYKEYIDTIRDEDAIKLKLADLTHNMMGCQDVAPGLWGRYHRAYAALTERLKQCK